MLARKFFIVLVLSAMAVRTLTASCTTATRNISAIVKCGEVKPKSIPFPIAKAEHTAACVEGIPPVAPYVLSERRLSFTSTTRSLKVCVINHTRKATARIINAFGAVF